MNIAKKMQAIAKEFPTRMAIKFPRKVVFGRIKYSELNFQQLDSESSRYAQGLQDSGVTPGMKVIVLVNIDLNFFIITYALLKLGAIPVLIDPGMGIKGFLNCVKQVKPDVFIGTPKGQLFKLFSGAAFNSIKITICVGTRVISGLKFKHLRTENENFTIIDSDAEDMAAILFTSGSTGPAKGVVYTHRVFTAQVEIIKREFNIDGDSVDLPAFPLFGLFGSAMGMGVVIPKMNFTKPAAVNPKYIIKAVKDNPITQSFGSPALWNTVSIAAKHEKWNLPKIKKILMSGAPVSGKLHRRILTHVLGEDGETYAPYGATESLPIAYMRGSDVINTTWKKTQQGFGTCVGTAVKEAIVRVIKTSDSAIEKWSDELVIPNGEIGELVVSGPMVTKEYYGLPKQTKESKIYEAMSDGSTRVWHRIGDVGYIDNGNRIWFCGRKAHRVTTEEGDMYTVCCEAIFNCHPKVFRSALVGVPHQNGFMKPVIVIEPKIGHFPKNRNDRDIFISELISLAANQDVTKQIAVVLFHKSFPVDIRHNAKIFREKLAVWANKYIH